jgi:hypothetical protein
MMYVCEVSNISAINKMVVYTPWQEEKDRILNLPLEEKRLLYKSRYVPLCDIDSWRNFALKHRDLTLLKYAPLRSDINMFNTVLDASKNKELVEKVSLFMGDIATLELSILRYSQQHVRLYKTVKLQQ